MHFLINVLTWLFFIGMGGSLVVIVLTLVDDFREIFTEDTQPDDLIPPKQPTQPRGR
jgi:hypothetical protein